MKRITISALLILPLVLGGCAAHTSLAPLGKGNTDAHLGIGGPIVEAFDTHIPIPYVLAGVEHGVRKDVNVSGSLHLLPLAFSLLGADFGATWFPVLNSGWIPTLGVGPRLFMFASLKGGVDQRLMAFPTLSFSSAWQLGGGLLYVGGDVAIPLESATYDEDANSVLISPFVGYRWRLGARLALLTELKWQGANVPTNQVATNYASPGERGAIAPLVALQRRF